MTFGGKVVCCEFEAGRPERRAGMNQGQRKAMGGGRHQKCMCCPPAAKGDLRAFRDGSKYEVMPNGQYRRIGKAKKGAGK